MNHLFSAAVHQSICQLLAIRCSTEVPPFHGSLLSFPLPPQPSEGQTQNQTDPSLVREIVEKQDVGASLLFCQPLFCSFCVPGFPGDSDGKEFACSVEDLGLIPGLRRSPGEGNGNLFQYSCLENSMNRGAWQATVHGVAKSQT